MLNFAKLLTSDRSNIYRKS